MVVGEERAGHRRDEYESTLVGWSLDHDDVR